MADTNTNTVLVIEPNEELAAKIFKTLSQRFSVHVIHLVNNVEKHIADKKFDIVFQSVDIGTQTNEVLKEANIAYLEYGEAEEDIDFEKLPYEIETALRKQKSAA